MNLIESLKWRGMIQDIIPGTEEQLFKEMTAGYVGFDPTAESLHIGSLIPILLLVHFQRSGHKPFALIGGATGMIGDPSGKSEERNLLSEAVLQKNVEGIKHQLEKFLDFDNALPNKAEVVNNYEWFKNISFLDFIRDTGKHITVNYMMAKDSVKKRIEGEAGISFTEFSYQLIQGFDYYYLNKNYNVKIQMGGSDQWGNITTGTELIRRKAGQEAFAFTCPLLKKSDGTKFGKSEGGNIWLDAERTTPYQFYQFWLNSADEDAKSWIKIFTFLEKPEIESLVSAHEENPSERMLQKRLAEEVTAFVHGKEALAKALETTAKLFSAQPVPVADLSIEDLENLEGVKKITFPMNKLEDGIDIVSFLAEAEILSSKGEARKMIQNNGISLNRNKVDNPSMQVKADLLLHNKFLLVQKGKKHYFLVELA